MHDRYLIQVRELDVELETTKQRSKENLQQAVLIERERITQMQWDMEEIRRKSMEMEAKLKFEKVLLDFASFIYLFIYINLEEAKHKR